MNRVPRNRYVTFALIVCAGIALDLGSKHLIFDDLGYPGGGIAFKPGEHATFDHPEGIEGQSKPYLEGWLKFRLFTSFNHGALWGIGQGWTNLFAIASVAAIVGVVVWLFVFSAAQSRWLTVALALVMAGTIGNLYDRMGWHGYTDPQGNPIHAVRDFFLFTFGEYNYPIFNVADICLVTGAIMLVVQSFLMPEATAAKEKDGKESADSDNAKKDADKAAGATAA